MCPGLFNTALTITNTVVRRRLIPLTNIFQYIAALQLNVTPLLGYVKVTAHTVLQDLQYMTHVPQHHNNSNTIP